MELNRYVPCKDEEIKIHGRTVFDNPLTLFWTGSGIELNTDGSELYIETETDYSEFEQWIRIEINGFNTIKMPLQKGKSKICVFHGMSKETIKNVRLIKEVQPMQRDIHSYLKIHAVESDGRLYPMQDRKYKIEFIGDSITSGEGLGGTKGLNEWLPIIELFRKAAGECTHHGIIILHTLFQKYILKYAQCWIMKFHVGLARAGIMILICGSPM